MEGGNGIASTLRFRLNKAMPELLPGSSCVLSEVESAMEKARGGFDVSSVVDWTAGGRPVREKQQLS